MIEHKYFARGIGSIREVDVRGGSDQIELVGIGRRNRSTGCWPTPKRR